MKSTFSSSSDSKLSYPAAMSPTVPKAYGFDVSTVVVCTTFKDDLQLPTPSNLRLRVCWSQLPSRACMCHPRMRGEQHLRLRAREDVARVVGETFSSRREYPLRTQHPYPWRDQCSSQGWYRRYRLLRQCRRIQQRGTRQNEHYGCAYSVVVGRFAREFQDTSRRPPCRVMV